MVIVVRPQRRRDQPSPVHAGAGFVGSNVSTIPPNVMTEAVRRLTPPSQSLESRARTFGEAMASARGKHVLIALRGHPDPDGIACAITQAHIAQRMGVAQTTVGYCQEVSHRENRALVKLLGLELRKIKTVAEVGKVDFLSLVDAHEVDPELTDTQGLEVLTI